MGPAATPREKLLQRLDALRVAKELFLSDWYARSARDLFDADDRDTLARIADESRRELELTEEVLRRWADFEGGTTDPAEARQITRATRRDFLRVLVEAKEAAGEVFERAASIAPPHLKEEFLALGAVDFRHAIELRDLLLKAYLGQPSPPSETRSPTPGE